MSSDTATYLYCVVHSATKPALTRVPQGVPGAGRPGLVAAGRVLHLVVAEVPLETYGPGRLDEQLRDMPWVGDVALAHEAVVEHFARRRGATVVPMKLFTMFSSRERAVRAIATRRHEIAAVVARVRGCAEWGVRMTRCAADPAPRAGRQPTSGSAFLAAKKAARDRARDAALARADAAEAAFAQLASKARAVHRREREPDGAVAPPLLDAAFLVPAASTAAFKTAARRAAADCARSEVEMVLTGPWPPYNFVRFEGRA